METHKSLDEARAAAKVNPSIARIIEINHSTEGRCFIKAKAPMETLRIALKSKPMAEIKSLIAEYPVLTEAETAEARRESLRHERCERCGKEVDGKTAYSQQEWYRGVRVSAYYCDSCHRLLSAIGAGEHTALQERATERHSVEPETKQDY